MPLLGQAAMLLSFDVAADAIAEHDDWHTHEHLPERLSIPGFIRGTRWVALSGHPRYFVLYEVAELATLTSAAYLQRLNNPSPWTAKMMRHYRSMSRGLCTVTGSFGVGLGHVCRLLRFKPRIEAEASMRNWLLHEALPPLQTHAGVGSIHLLEQGVASPMTNEQRIRGADETVDWAIVLTGYREESLAEVARGKLDRVHRDTHGGTGVADATYRIDYLLSHDERVANA